METAAEVRLKEKSTEEHFGRMMMRLQSLLLKLVRKENEQGGGERQRQETEEIWLKEAMDTQLKGKKTVG